MENNISIGGFFRQNRILERFLLTLGLCLFVVLSVRGIDKIGDRAVAAGEAQKQTGIGQLSDFDGYYSPNPSVALQAARGLYIQSDENESHKKGTDEQLSEKSIQGSEKATEKAQKQEGSVVRAQKPVKQQ